MIKWGWERWDILCAQWNHQPQWWFMKLGMLLKWDPADCDPSVDCWVSFAWICTIKLVDTDKWRFQTNKQKCGHSRWQPLCFSLSFLLFFFCFPIGVRRFTLNMFFCFFPISSPVFFGGWGVEDSWHPTGTSPGPGGGLIPVYFITMMSQLHMIICMLYRCYITIFDNYRTISNH